MTINSFTALLFAAVLTLQGCGSGTENHKPAPAPQSIVDVASADGRLTDFILALEFKEYPGITFYMPAGQGYHGQTSSSGEPSFKTKSHYKSD